MIGDGTPSTGDTIGREELMIGDGTPSTGDTIARCWQGRRKSSTRVNAPAEQQNLDSLAALELVRRPMPTMADYAV